MHFLSTNFIFLTVLVWFVVLSFSCPCLNKKAREKNNLNLLPLFKCTNNLKTLKSQRLIYTGIFVLAVSNAFVSSRG